MSKDQNLFIVTLTEALKNFNDPAWLGEHSPFAAPYFLGNRIDGAVARAVVRGKALQRLLREAVNEMKGDELFQDIIKFRYFEDLSVTAVLDKLNLAKSTFHKKIHPAIDSLAEALVHCAKPALRLETPPPIPQEYVGRKSEMACALHALESRKAVALTGSGGVGKTTLGAAVAQGTERPCFWYTFRPGLNDQLSSLLFALGFFFSQHKATALWSQLVAENQKENQQLPLDVLDLLVRADLEKMPSPLLCFDEVDLLQPEVPAHAQLIQFLDGLRTLTPLLYMGQHALLAADYHIRLEGFTAVEMTHFLAQRAVQLSSAEQQRLSTLTLGNPRLIELALALLAIDEPITALLDGLAEMPSLEYLFSRILQRLTEAECAALMQLAVFRNRAPEDAFLSSSLSRLIVHRLIQRDGMGGIDLIEVYRLLIYRRLPLEKKQILHNNAATIRSERGSYTAAVYHLVHAGHPEAAIQLWREHQQQEIAQGQAGAALHLWRSVLATSLSQKLSQKGIEALTHLCAMLTRYTGDSTQALADIDSILWKTPVFAIDANLLKGVIANDLSEYGRAETAFDQALLIAAALIESRTAQLYKGRSWMYIRQRELLQAEREADLARCDVEYLDGYLAFNNCQYAKAAAHYHTALELARSRKFVDIVAKCSHTLASVLMVQDSYIEADRYLQESLSAYTILGDRTSFVRGKIMVAVLENYKSNYETALIVADETEKLLSELHDSNPWFQAVLAQARSEANLALGEIYKAKAQVELVIAAEEINVLPDAYRVYGEILLQRGQLDEAEKFVRESIKFAEKNQDLYLKGYAYRILALIYQAQDKSDSMRKAREEAIACFEEINLPNEVARTQRLLP